MTNNVIAEAVIKNESLKPKPIIDTDIAKLLEDPDKMLEGVEQIEKVLAERILAAMEKKDPVFMNPFRVEEGEYYPKEDAEKILGMLKQHSVDAISFFVIPNINGHYLSLPKLMTQKDVAVLKVADLIRSNQRLHTIIAKLDKCLGDDKPNLLQDTINDISDNYTSAHIRSPEAILGPSIRSPDRSVSKSDLIELKTRYLQKIELNNYLIKTDINHSLDI